MDRPLKSAFLMKLVSAFGTPDHDMPLPPGDADLLVASGAFVDVVILHLRHVAAKIREAPQKLIPDLKKLLVLFVSLGNVSGKHSPVKDNEDHEGDRSGQRDPYEHSQDYDRKKNYGEEAGKAVHSVSSLHKFGKTISEFIKHKYYHVPLSKGLLFVLIVDNRIANARKKRKKEY